MTKRSHARQIFNAALKAADPYAAVLAHLSPEDPLLRRAKRIFLLGAGKASAPMARAVEKVCGRRIAASCVVVKDGHTVPLRYTELRESGHPVPDERGVAAARRIAALAAEATAEDLVICCISGGASALMPLPAPGISLAEKQEITRRLLAAGANIHEMNAVRKHLSAIKGGQLARLAAPAPVLTLILSDVIGDDVSTIGSGPTAPDPSTLAEVKAIFERHGINHPLPALETPKKLSNVTNRIVGSNAQSIRAAAAKAKELGYKPLVLSTTIEGETREIARMHVAIARECLRSGKPVRPPVCLLSGGETTVTLRGPGKGGRNQEFALAAALELRNEARILVLSAGTDGTDGPPDAAGACATGATARALRAARAALDANDSYTFLGQTGDLLITGPTRTNVMDVRILLVS
ncbi:MAG: glycerate kinase [Acidobacteriota bacterium]